jgi:hypothetical protein
LQVVESAQARIATTSASVVPSLSRRGIFVAAGAVFEFVVPLLLIIKGFSTPGKERQLAGDHLSDPVEPIAVPVSV